MNKYLLLFGISFFYAATFLASGLVQAQNMGLEWAKSIGGKGSESSRAMVTDVAGNVYVTGSFVDTVDFDPGSGVFNLAANGTTDVFIFKLDAEGNFAWAKQIGCNAVGVWGAPIEMGNAIMLDSFGHLLICGSIGDTVDFDPGPGIFNLYSNEGQGDAFVLKLDTSGNFVWAKTIGYHQYDYAYDLAGDAAGNIYITGGFRGEVDFDPGPGTSYLSANADGFVLKLDVNGAYVWSSQLYGVGINGTRGITLDTWGNIYVAGYSSVGAPPGAAWAGSGPALTVWKLDASGDMTWVYQPDNFGDPSDYPEDIIFDPAGHIYVCGWFKGTIDFDPGHEQDSFFVVDGPSDMFILKLDTGANLVWSRIIGGASNDQAFGIDLDKVGNVYVSGYFTDTVDFDPGPGQAILIASTDPNGSDAFVMKLDSAGNYKWAYGTGASAFEWGYEVVVGEHGVVYTTGDWGLFSDTSTVDFDPGPDVLNISSNGYGEIYVQKFACNDTTSYLITDTVCASYTLNGETYTEAGTYTQVRPNAAGCDSIITLQLAISEPNPIITVDGFILGTTLPYATYHWFLNGVLIADATDATYTVTENGAYTVAVTNEHGCSDTSEIYTITNVTGIADLGLNRQLRVFPNPAHTQVTIESTLGLRIAGIRIFNVLGAEVYHAAGNGSTGQSLDIRQLANGMYLLHIETDKGVVIQKLDIIR